jgi:hypothetical protein
MQEHAPECGDSGTFLTREIRVCSQGKWYIATCRAESVFSIAGELMPEPKAKPTGGAKRRHWAGVSDDRLIDLDLEINNPDRLEGLVSEVPVNFAEAHVEFKYDLRGQDVAEFSCVHGHHQHKAGFVMNVEGVRFMVGWICAKSIYDEDFDQYTADFDAAVNRRDALRRVRVLRDAMTPFAAWVEALSKSEAVKHFGKIRGFLNHQMPWVYDNLPALAEMDKRVTKAELPKHLCSDDSDVRDDCNRLMVETSATMALLTGDAQKIAAVIGALRARADGLVRRAEHLLTKLRDVELFFQPAALAAICEHANQYDNPKRRRYQAGLLTLACRGIDKASVEMPNDFAMPSRLPIDNLQTALSGKA